ncbi:MAG: DUF1761 domain-containing protein [Acidobacteriota bacterium]|nr:DUF1761 domain-containing protein [Acidobacteriota bacterium]
MLFLIWVVLFLAVVSVILLLPVTWRHALTERYSGGRPVTCPENKQPAVVHIDVNHAAATVMEGSPKLRLSDCTRWPERAQCHEDCLAEAAHSEPYKQVVIDKGRKPIHHLPVLLGAFAAWYVGLIWHSHYLFRDRLTHDAGLTQTQVKEIVAWLSPHLLTAAVCLLFAYGVAWLLAVSHRKGVLQGVLMSAALCVTLLAASWFGIERLPRDIFLLEAGYIVLAALVVGSIVGGLWDKLVLRPH